MTLPKTAISVRQPWALAIENGWKDVENRGWRNVSRVGEPVFLHASKSRPSILDVLDFALIARRSGVSPEDVRSAVAFDSMSFGCLVAIVEFGTTTRESTSPWAIRGEFHWPVRVVSKLAHPVPCSGALGFWTVPDDVLDAVEVAP